MTCTVSLIIFKSTSIIYLVASILLLAIVFSALKEKYNLPRFWYLPAILYAISFIIVTVSYTHLTLPTILRV